MRRLCWPVLLVLASCQFDPSEGDVEFLPDIPSHNLQLTGDREDSSEGLPSLSNDLHAQIGSWQGGDMQADPASLATRLEEEALKLAESEAKAAESLAAQELAELELITAQAAWLYECKQREELVQECEFLLQRIREFDELFDKVLQFEEKNHQLLDRVSDLEVELYETRVYQPSLADLSIEDAKRFTKIALGKMAPELDSVEALETESGVGLRILNQVLFASGQTPVGVESVAVLQDLAPELLPTIVVGGKLIVIGHTDSEPLLAQQHRFPLGNFQLSCMRALEVANVLVEAGIHPIESR